MEDIENLWQRLSKVDVDGQVKHKGKLKYLSWAYAWGHLKKQCPKASFEKHLFNGLPYALDPNGNAYVMVSVTAEDQTVTEVYAVTNNHNKATKNPDSFDVNTALQRALTKAIAYHGLGYKLYAGEDLPDDTTDAVAPTVSQPEPPPEKTEVKPVDEISVNRLKWAEKNFGECKSVTEVEELFTSSLRNINDTKNRDEKIYEQIMSLIEKKKESLNNV